VAELSKSPLSKLVTCNLVPWLTQQYSTSSTPARGIKSRHQNSGPGTQSRGDQRKTVHATTLSNRSRPSWCCLTAWVGQVDFESSRRTPSILVVRNGRTPPESLGPVHLHVLARYLRDIESVLYSVPRSSTTNLVLQITTLFRHTAIATVDKNLAPQGTYIPNKLVRIIADREPARPTPYRRILAMGAISGDIPGF
jgi:hypothetical protein